MGLFTLFRVHVYLSSQGRLFSPPAEPLDRAALISMALSERPEFRRHTRSWHLGNVDAIDEHGLSFAVGGSKRGPAGLYNRETRDFIQSERRDDPFALGVMDTRLSVCAIAHNRLLSPSAVQTGRALARLLNNAEAIGSRALVEVKALRDPQSFISFIQQALAVVEYTVDVSRPNPFDVDELLTKPFQKYIDESNATSGTATIRGQNLDVGLLIDTTRVAASRGNVAKATAKVRGQTRPVRRDNRRSPVVFSCDDPVDHAGWKTLLGKMRSLYNRIRGHQEG